jgi:hypothetical protein
MEKAMSLPRTAHRPVGLPAIRASLLAAAAAAAIAGCAPAPIADKEARAKEATATALGGAPGEIVIRELESGASKWTWRAEAGGKTYECDADELLRLPDCRQIG